MLGMLSMCIEMRDQSDINNGYEFHLWIIVNFTTYDGMCELE